jgi:hypothetical protein
MLLIEFPITGDIRLPLLIMEFILFIALLEISLIFLIRFLKQEKQLRNFQELGYASLIMGFSLSWFFYIISDFYSYETLITPFFIWNTGSIRYLFLNLGYFSITLFAMVFLYCIERYKIFLVKRYVFTALFGIYSVVFLILFFIDISITQNITYFFWSIFIGFFIVYLINFIKKVPNKKNLYIGLLKYLSGIGLTLVGFLFSTDILIEAFGLPIRFVGDILQLSGLVILSLFFLTLPPFSEFDWKDKLEAIFVMNPSGICLYYHIFKEKKQFKDENLISAAFSSINTMINKLTQSESELSTVKKGGENIIIYSGKFTTGVLYLSEDLNYPKVLLKEFIDNFELTFHNILSDWDGNVVSFNPAKIIAKRIFQN